MSTRFSLLTAFIFTNEAPVFLLAVFLYNGPIESHGNDPIDSTAALVPQSLFGHYLYAATPDEYSRRQLDYVSSSSGKCSGPNLCASTDSITVLAEASVTYCYKVSNTGDVPQTRHDLGDSELGKILADFAFNLQPGASVWLTQSATIKSNTVNTATWTAYNPGPIDVATDTDSAIVTIVQPASFPVCTGFENGLPNFFYQDTVSSGLANDRVAVTTAFPHNGNYALDLDTNCDGCGGIATQAAVLVVDLAGQSDVFLNFWVHEHGDENNPSDGYSFDDICLALFPHAINLPVIIKPS